MTEVGGALLSVALWTGTAQVDVMIWEGGGEHPYTTDFTLEYRGGDKRNTGDRRVGIGRGLFVTDVEVADSRLRSLDGGSHMRGAYDERHERSYGGSPQHLVRYQFDVKWDLHRTTPSPR